jgi:hypothetical protein
MKNFKLIKVYDTIDDYILKTKNSATFEHFQLRVLSFKDDTDLFLDTTGVARLCGPYPERKILKEYYPNENGYIKVRGERMNFKRYLWQIVYPQTDLTNKEVFKIKGEKFNINNLCPLTKNEYLLFNSGKIEVRKNVNSGEVFILPKKDKWDLEFFNNA